MTLADLSPRHAFSCIRDDAATSLLNIQAGIAHISMAEDIQHALSKGKLQFYAVRRGRTTGVFPSWEAAKAEVSGPSVLRGNLHNQADDDQAGFSNAQYQGFADRESAEAYVKGDVFKGV